MWLSLLEGSAHSASAAIAKLDATAKASIDFSPKDRPKNSRTMTSFYRYYISIVDLVGGVFALLGRRFLVALPNPSGVLVL
ncbi:hypothetical protein R50071_07540 [Halioxenophilus aromaticivorans]